MSQPPVIYWTAYEVAAYLRLFCRDERKRPDPERPDPHKVHWLTSTDRTFPRPVKFGRSTRYVVAEVVAWCESRPRGGQAPVPSESKGGKRRGPKPKAVRS